MTINLGHPLFDAFGGIHHLYANPRAMQAYGMQGTPTLLLIDRNGHLRTHAFGVVEDLAVGAAIAALLNEGD